MNICYKTTTFLPSEGAISDCFQPFPLGHLWTFKKKTRRCAEMLINKKMLVEQVLAWSCFRPFPTISDRFIFSERLIGPIQFMEGWSSANPCKPWRLSFWCHPCARTLHQILHLDFDIQYSLKVTKSQELVKFNIEVWKQICIYIYIYLYNIYKLHTYICRHTHAYCIQAYVHACTR